MQCSSGSEDNWHQVVPKIAGSILPCVRVLLFSCTCSISRENSGSISNHRNSVGCSIAQLVACWPAVRQIRVQIPARHSREFFLLVTEKLVKKLMGERKMVFFSHFHIFPPWTMLYLVPLLRQLRY